MGLKNKTPELWWQVFLSLRLLKDLFLFQWLQLRAEAQMALRDQVRPKLAKIFKKDRKFRLVKRLPRWHLGGL
jgi:hypothetical protein